jgi:hypothetical protein
VPDNPYEAANWKLMGDYGTACKRLKFTYGPIPVRPGQNDGLIGPVTIQKPAYEGYITRFKPDLVDATGTPPGIEKVHLHHGTWLNLGNEYGKGPFFAAGEEKTIGNFPKGYGMQVKGTDAWGLLFMIHNAGATTEGNVWVTYEIDYVAKPAGDALGIVPVKPLWLDVQAGQIHPEAPSTSSNPVFNVQKGFGHRDEETGKMVCTWPKENCARHDVYGDVTAQQGLARPEVKGNDWTVSSGMAGTIVGLGGHLHPGGIRDEVSLVRGGVEKPIFISDAVPWDTKAGHPEKAGGKLDTWDFSMTVTGAPLGWKVKIKQGDTIRINAVQDAEVSWYENMGIVVAYVAPNDPHGTPGIDVFDPDVAIDPGVPFTATVPDGPGARKASCTPDADPAGGRTLCLRGMITHGHMAEASLRGGCPAAGCTPLTNLNGRAADKIFSAAFTYGDADLGVINQTGLPMLKKGVKATFYNPDTGADIWHTFTRCKEPCNGAYGLDYPVADGGNGFMDDLMDFDSTELGYGLMISPASGQFGGSKEPQDAMQDGVLWEFTPSRTGTFSFWCRIHPAMRGAFKVVE